MSLSPCELLYDRQWQRRGVSTRPLLRDSGSWNSLSPPTPCAFSGAQITLEARAGSLPILEFFPRSHGNKSRTKERESTPRFWAITVSEPGENPYAKLTKTGSHSRLQRERIGHYFAKNPWESAFKICSMVEAIMERTTPVLGMISGTAASGRRSAPVPLPFRTGSANGLIRKA
jgi:hypothetical protein